MKIALVFVMSLAACTETSAGRCPEPSTPASTAPPPTPTATAAPAAPTSPYEAKNKFTLHKGSQRTSGSYLLSTISAPTCWQIAEALCVKFPQDTMYACFEGEELDKLVICAELSK